MSDKKKNSGNWNSGYRNSGNWNFGNWNTGDWNSGDRNSGYFCTDTPKVRIFNEYTDVNLEDIIFPSFFNIILTEWIRSSEMTAKEKKDHPLHEDTRGYLKSYEYIDAWANSWEIATDEDKLKMYSLPNFDADIFKKITGIDVTAKNTIRVGDKTYNINDVEKALANLRPVK